MTDSDRRENGGVSPLAKEEGGYGAEETCF